MRTPAHEDSYRTTSDIMQKIFIILYQWKYTGKNFNISVFSPPYKCMKTCVNNSTFM